MVLSKFRFSNSTFSKFRFSTFRFGRFSCSKLAFSKSSFSTFRFCKCRFSNFGFGTFLHLHLQNLNVLKLNFLSWPHSISAQMRMLGMRIMVLSWSGGFSGLATPPLEKPEFCPPLCRPDSYPPAIWLFLCSAYVRPGTSQYDVSLAILDDDTEYRMPSYFLSTPLLPALFHRPWPDVDFWDVPMQAMAIMGSYSDDGYRHDDELASSEMAQTSRHASEMATGGSSTGP